MKYSAPSAPLEGDPDGILLVDKPAGMTSSDVVVSVRRLFGLKKTGHGGTLDPGATGLLILLIGKGTRCQDRVMGGNKTYTGTLRLGIATSTHDWEGEPVSTADPSEVTKYTLEEAIRTDFTGDVLQTPPMVSAIKVNGRRLYKMARQGEEVERQPRLIHLWKFSIDSFDNPDASFTVRCSKGTYIRTLCHDLGQAVGCGAHMTSLRRTACGPFRIEDAIPFETLKTMPRDEVFARLLPLSHAEHGPVL